MDDSTFNAPKLALNRIYTRGGDTGQTSLVGGQRVSEIDLPRPTVLRPPNTIRAAIPETADLVGPEGCGEPADAADAGRRADLDLPPVEPGAGLHGTGTVGGAPLDGLPPSFCNL